jgi:hypothetical protein
MGLFFNWLILVTRFNLTTCLFLYPETRRRECFSVLTQFFRICHHRHGELTCWQKSQKLRVFSAEFFFLDRTNPRSYLSVAFISGTDGAVASWKNTVLTFSKLYDEILKFVNNFNRSIKISIRCNRLAKMILSPDAVTTLFMSNFICALGVVNMLVKALVRMQLEQRMWRARGKVPQSGNM